MRIAPIAALLLVAGSGPLATADSELTIGSAAPPLAITHWMKGDEVTSFQPGDVYVLEFWATTCAPCVANMEHLSALQEKFAARKVHVIGLSDEPLQTTVKFLCHRYGPEQAPQFERTRYALATDPDRSVHQDYFEASGQRGIPVVFVIGKDARIEWIGHPTDLDAVLEAVVGDRWDRAAHAAAAAAEQSANRRFREARDQLQAAMKAERWNDALAVFDVLIQDPEDGDLYVPTRAGLLLSRMKDYERGLAYVKQVMEQHWEDNSWLLYQMAWLLSGHPQFPIEPDHLDLELAAKRAARAVELDPLDYYCTMLAGIQARRGDFEAAAAAQQRAIDALEALRPKILPVETERYEAQFAAMLAKLEAYRARKE